MSKFSFQTLSNESKDAFALMVIQGMNYLIPLITVPYLIAILGDNGYGYVGFSFAYVSYFSLLVEFGFGLSATKRMVYGQSISPKAAAKILTATVYAKLVFFVIVLLPYFILPLIIEPIQPYTKAIYCMFPFLIGQTITLGWLYQSIGKIRVLAILTGFSRLMILPLVFFEVKSSNDYPKAALIQSGVVLGSGMLSVIYLRIRGYLNFEKISLKHIRKEISESFPLFLSGVATSIYTQLFTIILGLFSTPAIVGVYSASERIIRVLCFSIYTPVNQAFFPKIARLALTSKDDAIRLTHRLLLILGIVMGIIGVLLIFCSPIISDIVGKDQYPGMTKLLRIMAFVPLIICIGGILGQTGLVAMGDNKTKINFRNTYFVAGMMALCLIAILSPIYKDVGAAVSMTITEAVVTGLMGYFYWRKFRNEDINIKKI